jgi:hypothetical protein
MQYVTNLLGGMDRQVLFEISEATFARDISRTLAAIDTVFKNGQDLKRFYADLLMHFRHLMLIKMDARPDHAGWIFPPEIEALGRQVAGVSIAFIDQVFTLLFNAESTYSSYLSTQAGDRDGFFQNPPDHSGIAHRFADRANGQPPERSDAEDCTGIVEAQSAMEMSRHPLCPIHACQAVGRRSCGCAGTVRRRRTSGCRSGSAS